MTQAAGESLGMRALARVSWLGLAAAVPTAAAALLGQWAVNAESFGAHDMGLALFFSFAGAAALVSNCVN